MCLGNAFPRKTSVKYFVVLILCVKDVLHRIPSLCSLLCMLIWIMSFVFIVYVQLVPPLKAGSDIRC